MRLKSPERYTEETIREAYAGLVKRLMRVIEQKTKPTQRQLRRVEGILDDMKELGECALYLPNYFNQKGRALCTLLRAGATYLQENHRPYRLSPEGLVNTFAARTTILSCPLPDYDDTPFAV